MAARSSFTGRYHSTYFLARNALHRDHLNRQLNAARCPFFAGEVATMHHLQTPPYDNCKTTGAGAQTTIQTH